MRIRTLDIDELNDRLAELEGLEQAISDEQDNLAAAETDEEREEIQGRVDAAEDNFTQDERDELKALRDLRDEIGERGGKIGDEGGPFVLEDDFKEYAQELAEDIGAIDRNASWPLGCIDWEAAADELKSDYSSIEYDGKTYLYRN